VVLVLILEFTCGIGLGKLRSRDKIKNDPTNGLTEGLRRQSIENVTVLPTLFSLLLQPLL
jgi:hypothetical protein